MCGKTIGSFRINRIRLEFKDARAILDAMTAQVLIESDWNLKMDQQWNKKKLQAVLIESDWNLKQVMAWIKHFRDGVLIESDWNLKCNEDSEE